MTRVIYLYTDASVRGSFVAPKTRRKIGPACGAWCAWDDDDLDGPPLFSGSAYLGASLGPQRAEYGALIHGLSATRLFLATRKHSVVELVARTDNRLVYHQMAGRWQVGACAAWNKRAKEEVERLAPRVSVEVEQVTRRHPGHKRAHTMAAHGWPAVLPEKEWQPEVRYDPVVTTPAREEWIDF